MWSGKTVRIYSKIWLDHLGNPVDFTVRIALRLTVCTVYWKRCTAVPILSVKCVMCTHVQYVV